MGLTQNPPARPTPGIQPVRSKWTGLLHKLIHPDQKKAVHHDGNDPASLQQRKRGG